MSLFSKIFGGGEDAELVSSAPHAQQLVKMPVVNPVEIWSLMRGI